MFYFNHLYDMARIYAGLNNYRMSLRIDEIKEDYNTYFLIKCGKNQWQTDCKFKGDWVRDFERRIECWFIFEDAEIIIERLYFTTAEAQLAKLPPGADLSQNIIIQFEYDIDDNYMQIYRAPADPQIRTNGKFNLIQELYEIESSILVEITYTYYDAALDPSFGVQYNMSGGPSLIIYDSCGNITRMEYTDRRGAPINAPR